MRHFRQGLVLGLAAAAGFAGIAVAKRVVSFDGDMIVASFGMQGRATTSTRKAEATPAYLAGNRIIAIGEGGLVIDPDSGQLIRVDDNGKPQASIVVGRNAGLAVYDEVAHRAYVADRMGDRIAVIAVGANALTLERSFKTPIEPYGVALGVDRKQLLVTTIADRALVSLDTATGTEKWRTQLAREPRGIAVSADGARAVVAYLATGTVDEIELGDHTAHRVALSTSSLRSRFRRGPEGESYARGAFAVTFMGANLAVVPYQRETPVQIANGNSERTGSYGGGFEPPVTHQLAFIGFGKATPTQAIAQIAQHQPRALTWDGVRDNLYVAGLGNDTILQLKNASTTKLSEGLTVTIRKVARDGQPSRCGADGLAVTEGGDLLVWCSFSRTVARVDLVDAGGEAVASRPAVALGPEVAPSRMTNKQHEGFVMFHSSEAAVSQRGAMACATCHPDSRADGLSWRIEKRELQTPVLAGRVVGTHPYKWDGGDKDLETSLAMTMKRLGGFGLDAKQSQALQAYVEMLPKVRTPTRNVAMVERGKRLFEAQGCRQCHDGAMYSDNERHKFTGTLPESDTPSLLGLAASAPYFHDGSAPTLEALLRDRGSVHGMGDTSKLSAPQIADLTAFLETL